MKQAIVSALLLPALLAVALCWGSFVQGSMDGLTGRLTEARAAADRGAWDEARALTEQATRDWQTRDGLYHALMRHSEIDEIHADMREVTEALLLEDPSLYNAANTRLICRLSLLAQMEQLSLQNVL